MFVRAVEVKKNKHQDLNQIPGTLSLSERVARTHPYTFFVEGFCAELRFPRAWPMLLRVKTDTIEWSSEL